MVSSFLVLVTILCLVSLSQGQGCNKIVASNVALTAFIPDKDIRVDRVADGYRNLDADVVCAQEFWHEEDMQRVLTASPQFEYHYSDIHHDLNDLSGPKPKHCQFLKRRGVCRPYMAAHLNDSLTTCVENNGCLSTGGIQGAALCVIHRCGHILRDGIASGDCIRCMLSNFASTVEAALDNCQTFHYGHRLNFPGLLLLSKKRINSVEFVSYFPNHIMTFERGYIKADIQDVGTVVCTHLSSYLGVYFEFDFPMFTNYEDQQRAEIQNINRTFDGQEFIFVGDMNTGPVVSSSVPEKTLAGQFPANYELLLNMGFLSPYMDQDGRCTYCFDNPVVNGIFPNVVIDHVLFKGNNYDIRSVERVLDSTSPGPLSDHYAVRVEVCSSPVP